MAPGVSALSQDARTRDAAELLGLRFGAHHSGVPNQRAPEVRGDPGVGWLRRLRARRLVGCPHGLHGWSRAHAREPGCDLWGCGGIENVLVEFLDPIDERDEIDIRERVLLAHQPWPVSEAFFHRCDNEGGG